MNASEIYLTLKNYRRLGVGFKLNNGTSWSINKHLEEKRKYAKICLLLSYLAKLKVVKIIIIIEHTFVASFM